MRTDEGIHKKYEMETKHRPSTDDDGVKHRCFTYCFAQPKITSKKVPEGIFEESIGVSR